MVDSLSYFSFHEMVHIKDPLLLIGKNNHVVATAGFLSRNLGGPLPYG